MGIIHARENTRSTVNSITQKSFYFTMYLHFKNASKYSIKYITCNGLRILHLLYFYYNNNRKTEFGETIPRCINSGINRKYLCIDSRSDAATQ